MKQTTFVIDGQKENMALPESAPDKLTGFARFLHYHPSFLPWLIANLRARWEKGQHVSVKAGFEDYRACCPRELGEEIPGVGRVGLNNSWYRAAAEAVLKAAPDLKGYVKLRER